MNIKQTTSHLKSSVVVLTSSREYTNHKTDEWVTAVLIFIEMNIKWRSESLKISWTLTALYSLCRKVINSVLKSSVQIWLTFGSHAVNIGSRSLKLPALTAVRHWSYWREGLLGWLYWEYLCTRWENNNSALISLQHRHPRSRRNQQMAK